MAATLRNRSLTLTSGDFTRELSVLLSSPSVRFIPTDPAVVRRRWRIGIACMRAIVRMQTRQKERLSKQERDQLLSRYYERSSRGDIVAFTAIRDLVFSCGQLFPESELSDMLDHVGYRPCSLFSLNHFFNVMEMRKKKFVDECIATDTETAFAGLMEPSCDDVSIPTLLAICEDYHLSEEVGRLITGADADQSGRIDFFEFRDLLESEDTPVQPTPLTPQGSGVIYPAKLRRQQSLLHFRRATEKISAQRQEREAETPVSPHALSETNRQLFLSQELISALTRSSTKEARPACSPRLVQVSERMITPRRPMSSVRGFGGSSARFPGDEPLKPLRPPSNNSSVRPLRHHRAERPVPQTARYITTPFEAMESSQRATERNRSASASRNQKPKMDLQFGDAARFNPFLGVPPKEAQRQHSRYSNSAIAPEALFAAAERHRVGDTYLPLICEKMVQREARKRRDRARREAAKLQPRETTASDAV